MLKCVPGSPGLHSTHMPRASRSGSRVRSSTRIRRTGYTCGRMRELKPTAPASACACACKTEYDVYVRRVGHARVVVVVHHVRVAFGRAVELYNC